MAGCFQSSTAPRFARQNCLRVSRAGSILLFIFPPLAFSLLLSVSVTILTPLSNLQFTEDETSLTGHESVCGVIDLVKMINSEGCLREEILESESVWRVKRAMSEVCFSYI